MTILRFIIFGLIASLTFSAELAFAKDKEFKFTINGYVSETVTNQNDYALLEASKYSLKKGYNFFTVEKTRRYDRSNKSKNRTFSNNRRSKPKLRTQVTIHCYDEIPDFENVYTAETLKSELEQKYAN